MYVLPLLCCAHNTMCFCVARIWESRDHGTLFLLRARARRRRLFFCVARIWESRDHGTLYFCSAHAAEVDVKETRSGHVPYGVVLRSSINAFCTIRGGFPKNQILEI